MKDAVRSRYPIYDPIAFHTIVNNPLLTRIARRYQLRFAEPLFEAGRGEMIPLGQQYTMSSKNRGLHNSLKRIIDGVENEGEEGVRAVGLWRRVAKSNQQFNQDNFGEGLYEVERIDFGRGY